MIIKSINVENAVKNCWECPFSDDSLEWCTAVDRELFNFGSKRPDWCPLKEIESSGEEISYKERRPMSAYTFDELVEIEKANIYRQGEQAREGVELRAVLNVADKFLFDSDSLWEEIEKMSDDEVRYTLEGFEYNKRTVSEAYREIVLLVPDVFKSWKRALKITFGKGYED